MPTNQIRTLRAPAPKLTAIPLDLTRRARRQIQVMAVRNGVSFEQQVITMVRDQLGA